MPQGRFGRGAETDVDVSQAMGLGSSADESAGALGGGGMSFLRGKEKRFMLSRNGVGLGFPSKADLDRGQPAMRYAMQIEDLDSPSPSSGDGLASPPPDPDSTPSPSPESKLEKVIREQQSWWDRLKSGT